MLGRLATWGAPSRSLLFGPMSLGDDLLCTAVLREARLRGQPRVMFTARPELFLDNHDPLAVRAIDNHYIALLRRMGRCVDSPYYVVADPANPDCEIIPPRHVIAEMCRLCGIEGSVTLRPYLHLREEEIAAAPHMNRQIAIHSTGLAAAFPYRTKEWGIERFAALAKILAHDFSLVQLGARQDPLLPDVKLDLRGRTTLREAAAVQAASLAFVGLEGFLVHLARAVDCPAIVIHGGRAPEGTYDYSANRNFHRLPACSPCGLRSNCIENMVCMTEISVADVAREVRILATQTRHPLPCQVVQVSAELKTSR